MDPGAAFQKKLHVDGVGVRGRSSVERARSRARGGSRTGELGFLKRNSRGVEGKRDKGLLWFN